VGAEFRASVVLQLRDEAGVVFGDGIPRSDYIDLVVVVNNERRRLLTSWVAES
jgi:hypothetical protein